MTSDSRQLKAILFQLESAEIPCVLVGEDPHTLHQQVDSDVDIVVGRSDLNRMHGFLKKVCAELNLQLVQVLQHESRAFYYVLSWAEKDTRCYLRLDICSDYIRYGRELLSASELLEERTRDVAGIFHIPQPRKDFIYYLLKKIDKGSINSSQFEFLVSLRAGAGDGAGKEATRFWGCNDSKDILQCLDKRQLDVFQQGIPKWKNSLRKCARRSLSGQFREGRRRLSRIFNPTGVWIAILGPDGCGKSSVIDRLLPGIEPAFRRTKLMHFRPKVGYRGPADNSHAANPHDQPDRSWVSSVLKLGYYAADYIVGYFLKVLPARICSTFMVFDRYYDDLLVDQKRYCYGGPAWLLRAVRWFIPKPDLVFCLDAPAEVLQARKQEVPFEVTARQRDAYSRLVSALPNGHVIDASQPLEKVVSDVEATVLDFMERRLAKRLKVVSGS